MGDAEEILVLEGGEGEERAEVESDREGGGRVANDERFPSMLLYDVWIPEIFNAKNGDAFDLGDRGGE